MNKTALGLCVLIFTAAFADARGEGGRSSARRGFSGRGRGGFARRLSRPKIARSHASGGASSEGVASRTGFGSSSSSAKGRSFARATPGGGGTGGPPTGGGSGSSDDQSSSGISSTPGAKVLSAGQQPQYSNPGGGGTLAVNGGGFVAIDQAQAGNVGRSPGVTWGGAAGGTKAGGLASMYGGGGSPTFDPSF